MARFRFVGNGDNDPSEVTFRGVTFPKDKPVNVDDDVLADKLRGNSHFEVVKGRPRAKDDT